MVKVLLDNDQKKQLTISQQFELVNNLIDLDRFVKDSIEEVSEEEFLDFAVNKNPYIALNIIKQANLTNEEKINEILERMHKRRGRIDIITADMRSGKTTLGFYLAYMLKKRFGETIAWFGPPVELPDFVDVSTMDKDLLPSNCTAILDEASVQFYNATSRQEKSEFIRMLPVISHQGRNLIAITQSTKINDVQFLRLASSIIFKNKTSFNLESERVGIDEALRMFMPTKIEEFLYWDEHPQYPLLLGKYPLPIFWKEKYSTPYAPFESDTEKWEFALKCLKELSPYDALTQVNMKSGRMGFEEIMFLHNLTITDPSTFTLRGKELMEKIRSQHYATPLHLLINNKQDKRIPNFYLTARQQFQIEEMKDKYPREYINSKIDARPFILSEFINSYRHGSNIIISIKGQPGTGKSTAGLYLAEKVLSVIFKQEFNGSRIYYDTETLLQDLKNIQRRETIIMDEQIKRFGVGSLRSKMEMENVEKTIRKHQNNFIWIDPEEQNHLNSFILETYGIDYQLKVARLRVELNRRTYGFITTALPSPELERIYNKKKDEFLSKVKSRKTSENNYEELARKVIDHPDFYRVKNKVQMQLLVKKVHPNLSRDETDYVVESVRMLNQ